MNLNDFLEKLRRKPARERERIAVIATGVAFAVIFVIWLVSFNEMNRPAPSEAESQPSQLEDLRSNFSSDRASIEEMFRELPAGEDFGQDIESGKENIEDNQIVPESDESQAEIPQLP